MPRDPQGAGTRTETKVEWRNVYDSDGKEIAPYGRHATRELADEWALRNKDILRIAVERIETTTTITREEL